MNRFSQIMSIFALILFTLAQVQGWTVERMFAGGGNSGNAFARSGYHK